ncbi:TonB-dependent receptor domain-containing protein [Flammeovirga sp. SJP92]|uniref:TonB-dependent receptor domain-containing protein n=1 Tax=Flammeovirga sp. SJP92 TaxID=1775430 RepID=UPI0007868269|nr:TonB-dependent receptor [Flammeovirga sp. SJP92]KXX67955.1 hypothetical protein AVL50_24160 [Flammeovirga sp. SJP92]
MKNLIVKLITVIGLLVSTVANANTATSSISGEVLDQQTNQAIAYVTVALLNTENKIVGGGISDENGKFKIKNINFGTYTIEVQSIGYEKIHQSINVNKRSMDLPSFYMLTSAEELEEVVVQGQRLNIERGIDKNVINVTDGMIADGNSVSEVLNTVPEISVGTNGEISLRGESNVRILIDGKPSQMSAEQVLQALPASSIEKIEVITNPSAKYDPDGLSGIINVITKKERMQGLNGNLSLNAGSREKYDGYLGLNYRHKKFNFFAQGTYYDNRMEEETTRDLAYKNPETPSLSQSGNLIKNTFFGNYKVGFDYFLDSTNTITFYYEGSSYQHKENFNYSNRYFLGEEEVNNISENGLKDALSTQNAFSLNHRKDFKKGALETDLFYGNAEVDMNATFNMGDEMVSENVSRLYGHFGILKLDYNHQIDDKSSFEVGYKGELFDLDTEQRNASQESDINYNYHYLMNVQSIYASYQRSLGKKFTLKAGLRGESATIDGTLLQDQEREKFNIDYTSLFPSVHLVYQINDNNRLGLSYSRRINRPNILSMIPVENRYNSTYVEVGNPDLQPSYTNSFSLDHNYNKNKFGLNTSVYVRHSTNIMRSVLNYDEERDLNIAKTVNLGSSFTGGASVSANYAITDWWSVDMNVNMYYLEISDEDENHTIPEEANPINVSAKLNSNLMLPHGIAMSINARYAGQRYDAQQIVDPNYGLNMAVRKSVLKNKGRITLKVDNIINSGYSSTNYNKDFVENSFYLQETPIYRASFSYMFGGQFKGRKNRKLHSSGGM